MDDWVRIVTDPEERARRLEAARIEFEQEGTIVEASEAKGARDLILARAFAHPRDKRIRFVESSHKYYLDGEALPISVTGFYGRFFSHFDAENVVRENINRWRTNTRDKRYKFLQAMTRLGASTEAMMEAIKYAWILNGEQQSSLGTALHRAIELTMNGQSIPDVQPIPDIELEIDTDTPIGTVMMELRTTFALCNRDVMRVLVSAGLYDNAPDGFNGSTVPYFVLDAVPPPPRSDVIEYGYFEKWRADNPHLIPVRAEFNVFADDMLLAGQIDMLMFDVKKKVMVIIDWKRTKSMDYLAFNDRRGKAPFGKLPDTNFGHYICQQSVYALILEEYYGVGKVGRMTLLQCHPDHDSYIEHEVPDIMAEVRTIFEDRRAEVRAARKRKEPVDV